LIQLPAAISAKLAVLIVENSACVAINPTPGEPAGAKGYGKSKTFKTPSVRESKSS
jgi:hypothetical protein